MKILFVAFRHSPLDNNSGSGTAGQFYKSFCEYGHQVRVIGPFNQSPIVFEDIFNTCIENAKENISNINGLLRFGLVLCLIK